MRISAHARRSVLAVFILLLAKGELDGQSAVSVLLPDFQRVSWLPSASSFLTRAAVPLSGVAVGEGGHQLGDSVTILAQSAEAGQVRQWAVALTLSPTKGDERKLRSQPLTVYLSNGSKINFAASSFEAMAIRVLGPFTNAPRTTRARDIAARSLVNPEFLRLGMQDTAALWRRLILQSREHPSFSGKPFSFAMSSTPFAPPVIAETASVLAPLRITSAEERAYAVFIPALMDFFRIASQTPGVRDMILEAADISWWSIITRGRRFADTHFEIVGPYQILSPRDWDLPERMTVHSLGLRVYLQGQPALICRFALATPRPPLLNTAGIVGIAAMRPDGTGPRLMLRVMAARRSHQGTAESESELNRR